MVGKKVGIQATGVILLRALLAKNKIPEKDVTIVTIGADMSPLLTGQVDVVTGWLTNTTALKVLGERVELRLWDAGVQALCAALLRHQQTIKTQGRHPAEIRARQRQGLGLRARQSRQGGAIAGQGVSEPRSRRTSARPLR